jgi:hypothetical protein
VLSSDIRSYYGLAWFQEMSVSATPAVTPLATFAAPSAMEGGFIFAVPEPSSWLMLLVAMTLLAHRRRGCREQVCRRA